MRRIAISGSVLTKLIILLALTGMILGGGLFAWSRARSTPGPGATGRESAEAAPAPAQTVELGEFLVNLRSADGALRYLQTEVSLVVVPEDAGATGAPGRGHGAGDEREPELSPTGQRYARDAVVEALSSQSFETLRGQTDRGELKAVLRRRVDEALEDYEVLDVLFTAFVMQ